jgi:serine protease AprX
VSEADEPSKFGLDLEDPEWRAAHGLPRSDSQPADLVVELNPLHALALHGAEERFLQLFEQIVGQGRRIRPVVLSTGYLGVQLSIVEMREILSIESERPSTEQAVASVWPDFPLRPLIDLSTITVKAPPARLAFQATGRGIIWGVVDSGIDARHPHFATYDTLEKSGGSLHHDFSQTTTIEPVSGALEDLYGHGTHVAGILAGGLGSGVVTKVGEHVSLRSEIGGPFGSIIQSALEQHADEIDTFRPNERIVERRVHDSSSLTGVAPLAKLVSLKVLDGHGNGRSSNAIRALRYVREHVNRAGLVIHGINMSLGYEVNTRSFAAGQSPLCVEVDRLVRSGVVVVAAAGNTGFGELSAQTRFTNAPLLATVNDPGNAALAITVGATHRSDPLTYGVAYFSSKGPTGDGRLKPDLVAPGERITSCATGTFLSPALRAFNTSDEEGVAYYVDSDGTSLAAPHVSGAVAAFLSDRPEFIGRPESVKDIFLRSATNLGRDTYFQGHGLVDVLRALQSV